VEAVTGTTMTNPSLNWCILHFQFMILKSIFSNNKILQKASIIKPTSVKQKECIQKARHNSSAV